MNYHDILLVVSSVAIALVAIFLCMALYQVTLTIRDARRVVNKAEDTVDAVSTFVLKPIGIIMSVQAALGGVFSKFFHSDDEEA